MEPGTTCLTTLLVCFSFRARRTTRRAALMIFLSWAVAAVVWPPWIISWPYIEGVRTVPHDDCYIQFIYSNKYMSIITVIQVCNHKKHHSMSIFSFLRWPLSSTAKRKLCAIHCYTSDSSETGCIFQTLNLIFWNVENCAYLCLEYRPFSLPCLWWSVCTCEFGGRRSNVRESWFTFRRLERRCPTRARGQTQGKPDSFIQYSQCLNFD